MRACARVRKSESLANPQALQYINSRNGQITTTVNVYVHLCFKSSINVVISAILYYFHYCIT